MKKYILLFVTAIFLLVGCGSTAEPDYTATEAESALNSGEDITDKTVEITVDKLVPDSAFGYNIQTGEHLNFVSPENPNVEQGETLTVTIEKAANSIGSWIITYSK